MNAIIMGATSGMGKIVAELLLEKGWNIGVAGRRQEPLQAIKALSPERVFTKVIDVTTQDAPDKLNELISEMGGIDLYFHSSGYGSQNKNLDLDIERRTLMTNGYGFTQMVDTAYNYFKDSHKEGQIAVISSVAGTMGLGAAPSYSATKRFQWHYISALAQQAHMQGVKIRFTDIRPGFVATDFLKGDKYPLLLEKNYVSKKILNAVIKKRRSEIIDWKYKILCFFWRMIPRFVWERLKVG